MARSAASATHPQVNSNRLNVDSGTSDTLVPPNFSLNGSVPSSLTIRTADNSQIKAISRGTLPLKILNFPSITAYVVPTLAKPLLSVSDVTDKNTAVLFLKDSVLFTSNPSEIKSFVCSGNSILTEGRRINCSYYLEDNQVGDSAKVSFRTAPTPIASYLTWHHRLSHTSLRNLQDLRRRGEIQVSTDDSEDVIRCEDCLVGKFS